MNKLFCSYLVFISIILTASVSFGQSDYKTVQEFKDEFAKIKQQLMDVTSLEELEMIQSSVEGFKENYSKYSELLDKALYPEKYEDMIVELNSSIALMESNFNNVEDLKVEVTDLRQKVDTLNIMNKELDAKLVELQSLFEKNSIETSKMKNVIAELRIALHKRDLLVMSMVDSLMPAVMREKPQLASEDEDQIASDIEKDNILYNIKTTIRDNIKYLDLTSLQPADIQEIQTQQIDFADTWSQIGPKLVEVYSEDKQRTNELMEIDSLFFSWTYAVEQEVWQSMNEDFEANGVDLTEFSDGEEFTNSVNQYIENEKSNIGKSSDEESEKNFVQFAENTWDQEIKPKWVSFLIENGMLPENNEKVIEDNIEVWRSEIYPPSLWPWLIISFIVVAGIFLLLKIFRQSSKYDTLQPS
jgi:hypothetical protein